MAAIVFPALCSLALLLAVVWGTEARTSEFILMPGEESHELPFLKEEADGVDYSGTRWAVLIAGSMGYGNYRHQADVCHSYQVLRNGGLRDENIVVFMYDDIANSRDNPHKGTIINHPRGPDVYAGVPKDYTGPEVTVQNFFAVLLGDKAAVRGGSGKVVDSRPEDHIFIYYSDHGGPGVLGMPNMPNLFARDLIETLRLKHSAGTYKEMVIYLEACESGSIFEGILPEGLNIYVTTASNARESSWGTYCPGMESAPPAEYGTCLGDLYSVAWMEDCEVENLQKETLEDQYLIVKRRTSNHNTYRTGSHVMEYGDTKINSDPLVVFLGHDPANVNISRPDFSGWDFDNGASSSLKGVNQRDADLLHYWHKYERAPEGSIEKADARQEILSVMSRRSHIDESVEMVGELLFGSDSAADLMNAVRTGEAVVDDWECLKDMVRAFERSCGSLREYGLKHMRSFANFCNAGIAPKKLSKAAAKACASSKYGNDVWAPITSGFSA